MKKEFEWITKAEASELIKTYHGTLINEISSDAGNIYVLSNNRAIITSIHEKEAYYYFSNQKFIKNQYEDDEILANQNFFLDFEENRKIVIDYINSIYPGKDVDAFYQDNNTKRQSDFLHKKLLRDKNYISYRNAVVFIGEIINYVNHFEWRTEKTIDTRVNKEVIIPYLYDPIKKKKINTHYFKQLLEYNTGDRKRIYL